MKKAGLKSFICSFVLSLFMILTINGIFAQPQPLNSTLKIPQKNITLFLKNEPKFASKAEVIPIKKIALRLPEKEVVAPDDEKIPLDFSDEPSEPTYTELAANDIGANIPLEISQEDFASEAEVIYDGSAELTPEKPKIIKNFDTFIKSKPDIDEKEIIIAKEDLSSKDFKNGETEFVAEATPAKSQIFPQKAEPIRLAMADTADKPFKAPKSLIPLEYNDKIKPADRKVEIAEAESKPQVALADKNIPISSMDSSEAAKETPTTAVNDAAWQPMAEKYGNGDDKWLIAKGAKHPKNSMVLEQKYSTEPPSADKNSSATDNESEELKLAEVSKNLLIPIPEEIMKEKNLTPQLSSSPYNREIEARLTEREKRERGIEDEIPETPAAPAEAEPSRNKSEKSGGILNGITSFFKGDKKEENKNVNVIENPDENFEENNDDAAEDVAEDDNIMERIRANFKKKFYSGKILPTEIRLAFQPNRAEISGQTLDWLEAFANKTNEDASTGLEIRIDGTSSRVLQQKRLNLLYNILANKGVAHNKIHIVFTSREPNSFVVRTIKIKNDFDTGGINNMTAAQNGYYLRW